MQHFVFKFRNTIWTYKLPFYKDTIFAAVLIYLANIRTSPLLAHAALLVGSGLDVLVAEELRWLLS